MKTFAVLMLLVLAFINPASASPQAGTSESQPADARILATRYNGFGFDLYREISGEYPGTNTFVSPVSVALALAMAYGGAAGGTEQSMAEALRVDDMERTEFFRISGALTRSLHGEDDVDLAIANSLWLRKGFTFYDDFARFNRRVFEADIFTGLHAQRINDWVKEKTREKITKIVDTVPPEVIAYIINAIYFKGTWTKEFDTKLTREEDFHLAGGGVIRWPRMRRSGEYRYLEGDGFRAACLPYGTGRVSMYVFLPDEGTGLQAFQDMMNVKAWESWMTGFQRRKGHIELPRFTMEFETSLASSLQRIGMKEPFSPGMADFSRMGPIEKGNIYISDVIHKTYVDVNEEGTEAAAVTSVVVSVTSARPTVKPFSLIVDRPFFFAIRDNETGAVLFIGSVFDPS